MSLIVVQAGHLGRTTGTTGAPGEQVFTEAAAKRTALHLRAIGHTAQIIRADVADVDYRGDLFVALHYDSSTLPHARGASVGYQTPEGKVFAEHWKRHYKANGWTGGFRADNYTRALHYYYGVRRAVAQGNRRAFIVEAGFHSNHQDAVLLASPAGPDRVGIAVAAAVVDLLGAVCPPSPPNRGVTPSGQGVVSRYPGLVGPDDRGDAVAAWQRELNYRAGSHLVVDGIFGDRTEDAVRDFQSKHHLRVDGMAGPVTWHALLFA